jgi:iron complex transport system substrate-binding protein
MKVRRIVSLLPAASEMVYALGIGDRLLGVTHECDFPADAKSKPIVSRPAIDLAGMTTEQIDATISARIARGESIYEIDEILLRDLEPDLIVTQNLCQVCAPSGDELSRALESLKTAPKVLFMSPNSIEDILRNVLDLSVATGREGIGNGLVAQWVSRLQNVRHAVRDAETRPRVFCAEWVDPIFSSGHWLPQMVEIAGGFDGLGRPGSDSRRVAWSEVIDLAPELIIVSPCGFHLNGASEQTRVLQSLPHWNELPAVKNGRVYAVDADSYFARPGPRIIDGTELLAHLIHPQAVPWSGPPEAYCRIATPREKGAA